jgi:hypothetical protein
VKPELSTLCEFSQTSSHVKQIIAADICRCFHDRFTDVVATVFHESKTVSFVASIDHFFDILPNVF